MNCELAKSAEEFMLRYYFALQNDMANHKWHDVTVTLGGEVTNAQWLIFGEDAISHETNIT